MTLVTEILISVLLVVAGIFGIVGSFGLLKLPDPMTRLHAPTKATTIGIGGVLIASMLYFGLVADSFSWHEILISLFLFLTAPITANFIAKAHLHREVPVSELPPTGTDRAWATYDHDIAETAPNRNL
ncbi:MAG: Na+/H+ antiporter subunit G [Cereibacter changlensis]|jgi:multicomponent K+:H+ antiporter subunit G|uniref:Na+/H+ antiporter subunit G n=2 Tax=Cereibacter changlensis TaxID=402884 RepID=A0A2T4JV26_9RHOB|nr:Na+/H+ antiporter subunit G [Cereibacter changlensis]MBZ4690739.1 mrpG [Cereibacter sp.]PTE21770.1 Na+/H+ antiporter subunit G [Cereibacter changlensis JA139]PZX52249.1 multisubunit potassium/proton antiporter PhaG subunit [Cereibacter changlensis]TKA98235.1 Na+/H+ antiporter subunit G [Cereibacter changlensis]